MSANEHTEQHHTYVDEQNRQVKIQGAISRCLDTTKIAHDGDRASAVVAVKAHLESKGINWKLTDRGWTVPHDASGNPVSLQGAVEDCLLNHTLKIGSQESIREVVASGGLEIKAKSDLGSSAQKAEAISRYGLSWWEKLPQHREAAIDMNKDSMTARDYSKLSVRQKIEFQKTLTEPELVAILRRK